MTYPQHERLLAYTAQRAKARPEYLAWVLARYVEREHLSEAELAQRLGIATRNLPHLALCLRPRADQFAADVRQISAKFNIDAAVLAEIVRLVESFETFAATNSARLSVESGLLMAARARKQPGQDRDGENHGHAPSES
jgi:hypothetical protein